MTSIRWAIVALAVAAMFGCSIENESRSKTPDSADSITPVNSHVIYGSDDRRDLYEESDPMLLDLADATVALVNVRDVKSVGSGQSRLSGRLFSEAYSLCADEPYADQPTAAFCSGFLVGPSTIVTAGHCIQQSKCASTQFVFGYALRQSQQDATLVEDSDIYNCHTVIHSQAVNNGADFAVVELDRQVVGHTPLSLRLQGSPAVNTPLVVIGHPVGLPTKIAGGADVRSIRSGYLVANLDTYGGNSGSAVFNGQNGQIEGILVRGETDFKYDSRRGCYSSNKCSDTGCRGEDVTLIGEVLPFLQLNNESDNEEVIYTSSPQKEIPDRNPRGITDQLHINAAVSGRQVFVEIDIVHTWRGDLVVKLTAPSGNEYILSSRQGSNAHNIIGVYGVDLIPATDLSRLANETAGTWSLHVSDHATYDRGTLIGWSIRMK